MRKPTCETCVYWTLKDGVAFDNEGQCRKAAPIKRNYMNRLCWGLTHKDDWCGEHPDFPKWLEQQNKETK